MNDLQRPSFLAMVTLGSLYFAQGLPSGLLAHTLPALMRAEGVDVRYIGLVKLLAIPWFLKALWAPLVDRYGNRRHWILAMQSLAIMVLLGLSFWPGQFAGAAFAALMAGLLLLNTASATQDVATDGLAVSLLPSRWHGPANTLQVGAYKVGLILGGSALLMVIGQLGWQRSVQGMALLLVLFSLPVLALRHVPLTVPVHEAGQPAGFLRESFRGFFSHRDGMGLWLLVLLTYKVADDLGTSMFKPLLIDSGWSLAEVGEVTLVASLCGLAGAGLGGLAYYRWGAVRCLLWFGLLQAIGIAAWSQVGPDMPVAIVYAIAVFEQVADAMSTVTLFAVMMGWCRSGHEGGDYTLQASLYMTVAGTAGLLSGFVAHAIGFSAHFLLAGLVGVLALLPVRLLSRHALPD